MRARILFTPLAAAMAALVLYLAAVTTVRADDPPPVVAPVDRTVDGLTVDEWAAQALRWHHVAARYRRQMLRRWRPTVDYAYRLASAVFGIPYWQLHAVGSCESHHYPFARNGRYLGVMQLGWRPFGFSPFDPVANVLSAAATVQRDGSWRQWQCRPGGS